MNRNSSDPKTKVKTSVQKAYEKIFHEKQEGALCGQHCLNNALQSHMYSTPDLAVIAQDLNEKERQTMAEGGTHTKEYMDFMAEPSSNCDDTGYFSVQVLALALKNMNLDLVSLKNTTDDRCVEAEKNPEKEKLFICHQDDHWFALRRFGEQWINLNSVLEAPEMISDTYLSLLLNSLQTTGYTIFGVFGELPECEADSAFASLRRDADGKYIDECDDSKGYKLRSEGEPEIYTDDELLKRGIELSLAKTEADAIRIKRAAFLDRLEKSKQAAAAKEAAKNQNPESPGKNDNDDDRGSPSTPSS